MVTSADFRHEAAARGIDVPDHAGGALRVAANELRDARSLAKDLGLVVLGLDGLLQDGAVFLPLDDYIADLSGVTGPWEDRVVQSAEAASVIATSWGSAPSFVELTLEGLDE
jgi:hypothetical protein